MGDINNLDDTDATEMDISGGPTGEGMARATSTSPAENFAAILEEQMSRKRWCIQKRPPFVIYTT